MNARLTSVAGLTLALFSTTLISASSAPDDGWVSLFDGKTLNGWKASENPDSPQVVDGMLRCAGPRAHVFYVGPDGNAKFENFELSLEILTKPGANSGVYFQTEWQDEGWPRAGFEAQVNNTQLDYHDYIENKKGGSLYGIRNTYKSIVRDDEWYTMTILVRRPSVQIRINETLVVDYVEPANIAEAERFGPALNRLGSGTFALQCHDENSTVYYRNIRVRELPPGEDETIERPTFDEQDFKILAIGRNNFPTADLHTALHSGDTVDGLIDRWQKSGIFPGVVANIGNDAPVRDDKSATAFLQSIQGKPVMAGLLIGGADWEKNFRPATLARFDYLIADTATPGIMNLSTEGVVDRVVGLIENLPIDILANPMGLPGTGDDQAGNFWTKERMQRVIDAAVEHGVAFEINTTTDTPSAAFVVQAKAAGAKFTVGSGVAGSADRDDWSHILEVHAGADLGWDDMYVPGHLPNRIQRANK